MYLSVFVHVMTGDRIAVVKEGRLRALGTSRFLKQRFGLGYLLRMSLAAGTGAQAQQQAQQQQEAGQQQGAGGASEKVQQRVQAFVSEATVASSAGTELSLRLPREAVPQFPDLFEALEAESKDLGVVSYGIETTTLEEVFMRIVNEDNELLLQDHEESNRMLGASHDERAEHMAAVKRRDEQRNPISEQQMAALLAKGHSSGGGGGDGESEVQAGSLWITVVSLAPQVTVMVRKRYHQFTRSKGQWTMGLAIPLLIAILIGVLLSTMPDDLLASQADANKVSYSDEFATPIAAEGGQTTAETDFEEGFGDGTSSLYVGDSNGDLRDYIQQVTDNGGPSSTDGIYYKSLSSFFVMYNASYPSNFAGAVNGALQAAVSDASGGLLTVETEYNSLPSNRLGTQLNSGFFVAMLISLFGGSMGAAMSIVLSGERTSLVKHQQL